MAYVRFIIGWLLAVVGSLALMAWLVFSWKAVLGMLALTAIVLFGIGLLLAKEEP